MMAEAGMAVESETNEVHEARRTALELLFSDHVGDCLSPCHRLCPLRMNIPVMIRHLQAGDTAQALATVRDALPLPAVLGRLCHHPCEQGCRRGTWDEPAGIRDMERFAAEWGLGLNPASLPPIDKSKPVPARPPETSESGVPNAASYLPAKRRATGKSVAVIGAGPAGLTAAYHLVRSGHACTVFDRNPSAGGTLRQVDARQLPPVLLAAEIQQLENLGAQFKLGSALGTEFTLDQLIGEFNAVLLTVGELSKADGEALGLEMTPGGVKVDPDTFQTSRDGVFAAGRAVKPVAQLVRAMSEGMTAAECVHLFVLGKKAKRLEKPFSSVMGRLEKEEVKTFVAGASPVPSVAACDACAGLTKHEAGTEAERCLHCDCRSVGDCALQTYAQIYDVNATRFRQQRKNFEQYMQPGGVIFEPGKCILCGICVKLTEMAKEPLGLTFVGRGFDVRIATPFNRSIEDGLQKVAAECVEHCPTGALVFRDAAASNKSVSGF
jgi:ferredoxin